MTEKKIKIPAASLFLKLLELGVYDNRVPGSSINIDFQLDGAAATSGQYTDSIIEKAKERGIDIY